MDHRLDDTAWKRKIKSLIESNIYSGWDDPRLYTLRGLLNAGLTYKSLDIFMKETNYPVGNVNIDATTLWGINRKIIDRVATRYSIVPHDAAIRIPINIPEDYPEFKYIPKFHRNTELGSRKLYYSNVLLINKDDVDLLQDQEEITLMNYGNAIYENGQLTSKLNGD